MSCNCKILVLLQQRLNVYVIYGCTNIFIILNQLTENHLNETKGLSRVRTKNRQNLDKQTVKVNLMLYFTNVLRSTIDSLIWNQGINVSINIFKITDKLIIDTHNAFGLVWKNFLEKYNFTVWILKLLFLLNQNRSKHPY